MNYRSNMRPRGIPMPHPDRRPYFPPGFDCTPTEKCGTVNVPDDVNSLSMVYTISQCWRYVTDGYAGLDRGTIFDELDKPFKGYMCKRGGCGK